MFYKTFNPFFVVTDVVMVDSWQNKSFMWDDYLKNCNGRAAPAACFRHVCIRVFVF